MSDLRIEIIEAGYKKLITQHHPDSVSVQEKAEKEELCKRLAVAKDWLVGMVNTWNQPTGPHIPQAPRATETMAFDPADFFVEVLTRAGKNILDPIINPKKPRARAPRAPRRTS